MPYQMGYLGPMETALGACARAMGNLDEALGHHEAAAAMIVRCEATRAGALNDYFTALVLLDRDGPDDRRHAIRLLEKTCSHCQEHGYLSIEQLARQTLSTAGTPPSGK